MVKTLKYVFAFALVLAFAVPAFAQDDYPKFQITPGYGNLGLDVNKASGGITNQLLGLNSSSRHSGFALDTDYNLTSKFGVKLFTGYYNMASNVTLYTNTFGASAALRKSSRVIPFGEAGFGFGALIYSQLGGSQRALSTRIGGGVDVPFKDLLAFRVGVNRMGFHFSNTWTSGVNYSVGVVLTLSTSN